MCNNPELLKYKNMVTQANPEDNMYFEGESMLVDDVEPIHNLDDIRCLLDIIKDLNQKLDVETKGGANLQSMIINILALDTTVIDNPGMGFPVTHEPREASDFRTDIVAILNKYHWNK